MQKPIFHIISDTLWCTVSLYCTHHNIRS